MSFKTLDEMKDIQQMKASLKRLRKMRRQTAFLFKARCDALDDAPLLWVSAPGRRLNAQLIKDVKLGTRSIRGTVCREGGKLVFTTRSEVNKDKMARVIARIATKHSANIPLKRIQILTPKDQRTPTPTPGATPELEEKLSKRRAATKTPKPKPKPKPKPARPSPKERVQRLRRAAPRPVVPAEPEPTLDLDSLRADLLDWQRQLAEQTAAEAAGLQRVQDARAHLSDLGQMVSQLLKQSDLPTIEAGLAGLAQKESDPELPQLIQRARKATEPDALLELLREWFEDVEEEHRWEIEALRESAAVLTASREEMAQLIASVEGVITQSE
jgi:hypothetical protein